MIVITGLDVLLMKMHAAVNITAVLAVLAAVPAKRFVRREQFEYGADWLLSITVFVPAVENAMRYVPLA